MDNSAAEVVSERAGVRADHPMLAGHFPGHPIVPGAWLLAWVVAAATRQLSAADDPRSVVGVKRVKFARALLPHQPFDCTLKPALNVLRFTLSADRAVIAEGTLQLQDAVTDPPMISRRRLMMLVALGISLPRVSEAAAEDLAQLFAKLGARRERRARFTERRFSALLKAPAESSGTLMFRAPDVLEKRTDKPQREVVRIEGSMVTYETMPARGETQKRNFALADAPQLAVLVESLRATLAGDLSALKRHYDVSFTPAPLSAAAAAEWQLTLIPRERMMRDAVEKILLRGVGDEVNAVEIVEAGGDLTLLRISPITAPAAK